MPEEALEIEDPGPEPEQLALSRETLLAIEKAIERLSPEHRLCLVLVDVQGLDYDEAAAALRLRLGTLKSRLSRARAELRELIPLEFRPRVGG